MPEPELFVAWNDNCGTKNAPFRKYLPIIFTFVNDYNHFTEILFTLVGAAHVFVKEITFGCSNTPSGVMTTQTSGLR